MRLQYRAIRGAASALLIAAAVGTAGMGGMTSALAADPAMVDLTGTVVDGAGRSLAGVHLTITEELPPDGGIFEIDAITTADGSFSAELYAWGTTEAPASVRIATLGDEAIDVVSENCSRSWGVSLSDDRQVALAEAAPDPLVLTASTHLLGETCGTIATPPPTATPPANGPAPRPHLTPPPTDTLAATLPHAGRADRLGPALTIGFVVGLLVAAAFLLSRSGTRRRD